MIDEKRTNLFKSEKVSALLEGIDALNNNELESIVAQMLLLRAQLIAPNLDETETLLFERINKGLNSQEQSRLIELIER